MEIKKEENMNRVEFNPADYDYMDKMPLKGWIWEIIRRSESYRREYEKIEKAAIDSKEKIDEALNSFLMESSKMGIHLHLTHNKESLNPDYFLVIEWEECLIMAIPRPQSKYIFLDDKIQIKGTNPCNIINFNEKSADYDMYKMYEKRHIERIEKAFNNSTTEDFSVNADDLPFTRKDMIITEDLLKHLLYGLAVSTPENTVYIGISRKAKIDDIEKYLIPILRKYLEPHKPKKEMTNGSITLLFMI